MYLSEIPDRKLWFDSIFPFGPGPSPHQKKGPSEAKQQWHKWKGSHQREKDTTCSQCDRFSGVLRNKWKNYCPLWVNNDIIRLTRHHHHTNQRVTTRKATWGLKSKSRILDNHHSKASIANMYEEPFWTIYTKKGRLPFDQLRRNGVVHLQGTCIRVRLTWATASCDAL